MNDPVTHQTDSGNPDETDERDGATETEQALVPLTMGFNPYQVAELAKRAITPEQALAAGIVPCQTELDLPDGAPRYWTREAGYLPATVHPWTSGAPGAETTWQIKPDVARQDRETGKRKKYEFAKGWQPVLHPIRLVPGSDKILIVEGTHQRVVAGLYAPAGWSVYGIAGCRGWSTEGLPINDLLVCDGATVTVVLDADMSTNMDVFNAGQALAAELELTGAVVTRFAKITGGRKAGLDDILGARPEAARAAYVERLLAPDRCPEASKVKKPSREAQRAAEAAEKKAAREEREKADREREAREGRPMVDVTGDRHAVAGTITDVLKGRWDGKTLFRRGTPAAIYQRDGDTLSPLTRDSLRDRVSVAMRTGSVNPMTGAWSDGWPDDGTLGVLLSRAREFKPLDSVVNSPFVRRDGTVCLVNGYDEESRTFVRMPGELLDRLSVPEEPTAEDVRDAVKYLTEEWLGDFPFPTRGDRAGALALLLTPFVRGWMGLVPIAVIDGNGPSAGKGLLIDLITRVVLGRPAILRALPADNEEMRKAITSALLAGRPMMVWDEAHVLEGKALAQLLTVPTWTDRRLGSTTDAEIDNRVTFAALGNNVRVQDDVARRAYRVRIHPQVDDQANRDVNEFRHPDIPAWTDEHRAELLSAVLVLIRAWVVAGQPSGPGTCGSFERWSTVIGGILAHAGVEGFLEGRKEWLGESNTATDTWAQHLAWLHRTFGDRPFKTSDAADKLARAGLDAPLPTLTRALASPEPTAAYAQSLGMVYHHRKDQPHYGLTLRKAGTTDGASRWVVQAREGGTDISDITFPANPEGDNSDIQSSGQGTKGATGGSPPGPPARAAAREEVRGARGGGGGEPLPPTPLTPFQADGSPVDRLLVEASLVGYVSTCPEGHEEVLVDGLWYACPVCQPETVASAR